jgi:N-acetylmuramoyl-L-alanine amidase
MEEKKKVVVDSGHGGSDPGATSNGLQEKNLTLTEGLHLQDFLQRDNRFAVRMTRTTDTGCRGLEASTGPELSARADVANEWGADFFIALHFNSFNGQAHGVEVLDYNGTGIAKVVGEALCSIIEHEDGLTNRHVKDTNKTFAVIRETNAPAIIFEAGFIDNAADISHFDSDAELQRLAWKCYRALCAGFNFVPLPELDPDYHAPAQTSKLPFSRGAGLANIAWLGKTYEIASPGVQKAAHWLADQYRVALGLIRAEDASNDTSFSADDARAVIKAQQTEFAASPCADVRVGAHWGADEIRAVKNITD